MLTHRTALRAIIRTALPAFLVAWAPALAAADWPMDWPFLQSDRGWFFYRETQPPAPKPGPAPDEAAPKPDRPDWLAPLPPETPDEKAMSVSPISGPALEAWLQALPDTELEQLVKTAPAPAIRAWLPVLMDQALTRLDRLSTRKYLLVHAETLRRSETFSRVWQEVIWTDPAFDRPGAMPMGTLAQGLYEEERSAREGRDLTSLRESVSLLLAVEPNCRACEIQWKLLKGWADQYQFAVRPVASALVTLADGTAVLPYPQILDALQVAEFPTLYLIQPSSRFLTRLGTGILTEQEIATRLLRLIPGANPEGAMHYATSLLTENSLGLAPPPGE